MGGWVGVVLVHVIVLVAQHEGTQSVGDTLRAPEEHSVLVARPLPSRAAHTRPTRIGRGLRGKAASHTCLMLVSNLSPTCRLPVAYLSPTCLILVS